MLKLVLDLLFPRQNILLSRSDNYLTYNDIFSFESRFKKISPSQSKYINSIFVLSKYTNLVIHDLINRVKYLGEYSICESFSKALYQKIFIESYIFIPDPDIIVPVPSDPLRIIQRGYNVPEKISIELSKISKIKYANLLIKNTSTIAQNKLSRKSRLSNLKNAFSINDKLNLNLSNVEIVWIVDDISTTGSTLTECAKIIKGRYPYVQIYGVVISSN